MFDYKKILKRRCWIIPFIILCFCVFDYFPKLQKAFNLIQQIVAADRSVRAMSQDQKDKRKKELQEELRSLKAGSLLVSEVTDRLREKIGQGKNTPMVTLTLEDLASSSGVELTSVRPLDPLEAERYEVLPIEIGFQAGYKKLLDFLFNTKKSPALLAVHSLEVRKDDMIYPALDVRMTVYALFQHP